MSEARYLIGDVFDRLADIPDGSVDLVCTSPPFWRQRSYLPANHPDKARELGQESSPAEFIDMLLRLTAELRRVLAPHGSIAVELGDTMAGSGGAGGDYSAGGSRDVLAKSHCMIPEAYRLALAYGHNPITGGDSPAGRWIVRNVVDWCRRNPTPGDDGDKFRRASSDIVCATLNPRRWWDGEAVRIPLSPTSPGNRYVRKITPADASRRDQGDGTANTFTADYDPLAGDGNRPLFDWWDLASDPYPGAHYAVWPPEVARRLILAMCPERVCRTCGEPSRRLVETSYVQLGNAPLQQNDEPYARGTQGNYGGAQSMRLGRSARETRTVGWTDCGHNNWRRGMVLDSFGGSGTTAAVATGNGRNATLIDLDDRNLDLARNRIGMFLEVAS